MDQILDNEMLHLWLLIASGCLLLISLILFLFTFYKRSKKIAESRKKEIYQKMVDEILFSILFSDEPVDEIIERNKEKMPQKRLFKKVMIKSIVTLHYNYSGHIKTRLEYFYAHTMLVKYSLNRLESRKWVKKVEGIRDLGGLKYEPAFDYIFSLTTHRNKIVSKEALIAIIKLKGVEILIKNLNYPIYIDDWTQTNILYSIKTCQINPPDDLTLLLQSSNPSIVLLGVRLIDYYQQAYHLNAIKNCLDKSENITVKDEIMNIMNRLDKNTNLMV